MIFSKRLRSQDHTREFVVDEADERGWEVREEQDHQVVRQTWVQDWHRVENAMMKFALEAAELERAGWQEVRTSPSQGVSGFRRTYIGSTSYPAAAGHIGST